jgi:hypothetical protein
MYRHIDRSILAQLLKTTAQRSIALVVEARTDNANVLPGKTNARTGCDLGYKFELPYTKPYASFWTKEETSCAIFVLFPLSCCSC